ncbi:MAG TPA: diguanylate cyclase [Gaiellaceae bacterium]|nr:diguanylate cyclase [Gaiellaceae bacterium]
MTPTIAQRLGFRANRLPAAERRRLTGARAAFALFVVQPSVAIAAASTHGHLAIAGLTATLFSFALALVVLLAYERLGAAAEALIMAGGSAAIAVFIVSQEHGELYSVLYISVVLYACFFSSTRRAIVQVALVLALAAGSMLVKQGLGAASEVLVLDAGAFTVVAAIAISLRRRFVGAVERAQRTAATLDGFFLHAHAGFGVLDSGLRHVRVNEALADLMALSRDEIEGRTLREVAPFNADILEPLAHTVARSGTPMLGIEIQSPEGRSHLVSYYPLPGVGVGTAVMDVTHLKDVERRLEETNRRLTVLATTDELTGLPNRRMLAEQLDLALARARRSGTAVAVLCLDLDRFKEVNDTLGHSYGDEMLVAVSAKLRAGARDTDVVARLGGDEFVVLLADLDVQEAPALAATVVERIHSVLGEPVAIGPVELKVEASVGVAIYPLDSRDAKGLLAVADAAMYAGKTALVRVA